MAHQNGCEWNSSICSNAALKGHLEVLKWARQNGCPWTFETEALAKQIWPDEFL